MTDVPISNGVYQHYKGAYYRVLLLGQDSDKRIPVVIYIGLDDGPHGRGNILVRPLGDWATPIVWPDGVERPRFVEVA